MIFCEGFTCKNESPSSSVAPQHKLLNNLSKVCIFDDLGIAVGNALHHFMGDNLNQRF